jgi:hypothetical protein
LLIRLAATLLVVITSGCASALDIFAKPNLVAWCIVPFDAKKRGPAERAQMVKRLGLRRVAYDWRAEHVASFEDEIVRYKKHGIEFFAFWSWHDAIESLIRKHGITPQVWLTCRAPKGGSREAKIEGAVETLLPLVEKTRALGLQLGLYNHGGWGGEPANLVAVCEHLREHHGGDHVGIVYNFHHGHAHVARFAESFRAMLPYLLCVNLNGMAESPGPNKILPIGDGVHERQMIQVVRDSGYAGPIGILDHRPALDSEVALRANLEGLERIVNQRDRRPFVGTRR